MLLARELLKELYHDDILKFITFVCNSYPWNNNIYKQLINGVNHTKVDINHLKEIIDERGTYNYDCDIFTSFYRVEARMMMRIVFYVYSLFILNGLNGETPEPDAAKLAPINALTAVK